MNLQSEISSEEKKNPVIIIKDNDMKIALLIDKINELFDFQEIEPETNNDSYFLNKFIRDNSLYTLLNIEKIVNDKKIVVTDKGLAADQHQIETFDKIEEILCNGIPEEDLQTFHRVLNQMKHNIDPDYTGGKPKFCHLECDSEEKIKE